MKTKIKKISSSLWAMILALLMLVSSFSVMAGTVNVQSTGWNTGTITVYYNNKNSNWTNVYLIVGDNSGATRYTMGKVSGKQYLYSYTFTTSKNNYGAFYFTNLDSGYVENVNKLCYMSEKAATHQYTEQIYGKVYGAAATTSKKTYEQESASLYDTMTAINLSDYTEAESITSITFRYQKDMPSGYYNASDYATLAQEGTTTKYSKTITLTANSSYGCFIVKNGNKYYKADASGSGTYQKQLSYYAGDNNYGNSSHRVTYTTGTATQYKITFDTSNDTIYFAPVSVSHSVSWTNPANGTIKVNDSATSPVYVNEGSTYTVTLTPDEGYELDTLTVGGNDVTSSVTNNSYTGTMETSDVTVAATFAKKSYTVKAGTTTGGTVRFIDGASQKTIEHGKSEMVVAVPATGYEFSGWKSVDGIEFSAVNEPSCIITVTANATFEALFSPKTYDIRTADMTNGSVTVASNAQYGSQVTITPNPDSGYVLDTLTVRYDDGELTGQTVTVTDNKFTMPADNVVIQATFKKASYTITKSVSNGSIACDKTSANAGDTITFTVKSNNDYEIDTVTVSGATVTKAENSTYNEATYTFTMPAQNVTISATTKLIQKWYIFGHKYNEGWDTAKQEMIPAGNGIYYAQTTIEDTDTGDQYFGFYCNGAKGPTVNANVELKDDGSKESFGTPGKVGNDYARFYHDPSGTKQYRVYIDTTSGAMKAWIVDTSSKDPYDLTVATVEHAVVSANGKDANDANVSVGEGETKEVIEKKTVSVSVKVDNGYKCSGISVTGLSESDITLVATSSDNMYTYSFTMPSADATVTANITEKGKYTVTYSSQDTSMGTVSAVYKGTSNIVTSGSSVEENQKIVFTATPKTTDYKFDGWYSGSTLKSADASYEVTVTEAVNLVARFSKNMGEVASGVHFLMGVNNNNPATHTDTNQKVYKSTKAGYNYVTQVPLDKIEKGQTLYLSLSSSSSYTDMYFTTAQSYNCEPKIDPKGVLSVCRSGNYGLNSKNYKFAVIQPSTLEGVTAINYYVNTSGDSFLIEVVTKTKPADALDVYAMRGTEKTTYEYGVTTVTGMSEDCEEFTTLGDKYNLYAAKVGDVLNIETRVDDGLYAAGYYVYGYCINGIGYSVQQDATDEKVYRISEPYLVERRDLTSEEIADGVNDGVEITPIYLNKYIMEADDYVILYVDGSDRLKAYWGDTVAVYSYYYQADGSNDETKDQQMNSKYPGQPLMKQADGRCIAFIPRHFWSKDGIKTGTPPVMSANRMVSGLTFNNYIFEQEVHPKFLSNYQKSKNRQTYDFNSFKVLAENGYDTIMFQSRLITVPSDLATNHEHVNETKVNFADFDHPWDDLTNLDGELRSILGYTNAPSGKTFVTDESQRIRIVSVANVDTRKENDTDNKYETHVGQWSTLWYVYKSDGTFVTKGSPSDFIGRVQKNETTGELELKSDEYQTKAYKAARDAGLAYTAAKITYDSRQVYDNTSRSDGRWFYSRSVSEVDVNSHILYAESEDATEWTEDTYNSENLGNTTGASALVGEGMSMTVKRNEEVSISASTIGESGGTKYKFIGWATDVTNNNGVFTVTKSTDMINETESFIVSSNTDVYALYVPVLESDLVISHKKAADSGPGRFYVRVTTYEGDTVRESKYDANSVTVTVDELITKYKVELYTISLNGSKYQQTLSYDGTTDITNSDYVGKVCSSGDPAKSVCEFEKDVIYNGSEKIRNSLEFVSRLSTNRISVKLNYYNRKIEKGKPADISSTPTSYNYTFTSYANGLYKEDGITLDLEKVIEHVIQNSVKPSSVIEDYFYWTSQAKALSGITGFKNYHTNANYTATPYHTDCYGNVQTSGENWVTYYDANNNQIDEASATADNVSRISVWYFNSPKKYSYTMHYAENADQLKANSNGTYYGDELLTANDLFYNTRLATNTNNGAYNESSAYTQGYGIDGVNSDFKVETAEKLEKDNKQLQFVCWAYDREGKKVASTNIEYGLRISNTTELYAIYGEQLLARPGVTVSEVVPDTYFDSSNKSKTRINTLFNPYNCPDSDKNIKNVSVVYLRIANDAASEVLTDLENPEKLKEMRMNISKVVANAAPGMFKSNTSDSEASSVIVGISGSTANGYKYEVVDTMAEGESGFKAVLTNKNRGNFTTVFTTSNLANYTYLVFANMGYSNYVVDEENPDTTVIKNETDGLYYITSDNFAKYKFNETGSYVEN